MSETTKPGISAALAAAREAKGMTVAAVADKLKLTVRQVEAIESGDFARLPGTVFVRGFARNYARLLELPADDLLAELDERTTVTATITAPSAGVRFTTSPMRRWLLLPLAVLVLFLLLVAVLYVWLSRGEEAYLPPQPDAAQGVPVPKTLPLPAGEVLPVPPTTGEPAPEAASAPPVPIPLPPPPVPAAASPAPPVPAAASPAPPEVGGRALQLVADDDAWIEVVSADNQRYNKLLRSGEHLNVRGNPPFRLVVGNAAHVRLSYGGKAIDLKPFTGLTVARLTLE